MTHHTPAPPSGEDRPAALLRRAGEVEVAPPPRVWQAIAEEVAREAGPTGIRRGGRGAPWRLLAAAAAGALVAWAALEVVDGPPSGELLAAGELSALTEGAPSGSAEVLEVDGRPTLHVELAGVPAAGEGYIEVWLLRPDVSGMVTIGVLDGRSADLVLPDGIDLGDYPVVDISVETLDGDPTHGGVSIVRGELSREQT